jgi:hypothetical protein
MKPTAHQCDLPGVHWAKVSDSAVFRVLHVLFQQRSASSICNSKTAETVWRYEAERAKLTRDFHWHWRRIPFRIRSGPNLAQPVKILRRQVRMHSSPHSYHTRIVGQHCGYGQDADALMLASKRLAVELQALTERARKLAGQQIEILQALNRPQKKT